MRAHRDFEHLVLCLVASLVLFVSRDARADARWSVAPAPTWIASVQIPDRDTLVPDTKRENGQRYLLYDHQVRVSNAQVESFWHWARQVTNESGLQAISQINLEFDATYQRLLVHSVGIRRGSELIPQLDAASITLVQREPNLERQIYDGRQSAVLFLKDLRVGDIVEYAFTLVGGDPTLGGKYADDLPLGAPLPIDRASTRLLVPSGRPLSIALRGPVDNGVGLRPTRQLIGGFTEYLSDTRALPAYSTEPDAPSWYDPFPVAQISEFATWGEVVGWGRRLFSKEAPLSGPLRDWVVRTLKESASPDAFLLRATRFVQDEIRYVGIEVGVARRRPSDVNVVFERRYGDCKDKTALLVAILQQGGLVAKPALVNTTHGVVLDRFLPSPTVFDHVIVKVERDGATYWLDPTMSQQGGGLDRLVESFYDYALVLDEQVSSLERLARPPAKDPSPGVYEHFRVTAPGAPGETLLDTERVYLGAMADGMRAIFHAQTLEQSSKEYLKLYQPDYPAIHEVAPLERSDDRDNNVVRAVTHYAIPAFWTRQEGEGQHRCLVGAHSLLWALPRPSAANRTIPLGIPFPLRATAVVDVDLPFDLKTPPVSSEVVSPALNFKFAMTPGHHAVRYSYEVVTNALAVTASDMDDHIQAIDKARLYLGQELKFRDPLRDGPNWSMIGVAVATLVAAAWMAHRCYWLERGIRFTHSSTGPPAKFGGWLLLLGFQVVAAPFALLGFSTTGWRVLFSAASWTALTTPALPSYRPGLVALVLVEAMTQVTLGVYACTVAVTFLRKKRSFPWHFAVFASSLVAFTLTDYLVSVWGLDTAASMWSIARSVVFAFVWIAYLHDSKRAGATFVAAL